MKSRFYKKCFTSVGRRLDKRQKGSQEANKTATRRSKIFYLSQPNFLPVAAKLLARRKFSRDPSQSETP